MATLLVFFCVTVLSLNYVHSYSYTCYPNNTIEVSGLPTNYSSMNYFAIEDSTGTNCTVTGVQNAGTATITGCDKDEPITFAFSSYSSMLSSQIFAGSSVELVNITCLEISSAGVGHTIDDNLTVSISFDEETSFNVTYDVTSALSPTSANVGDSVSWTIDYPLNYSLQITSCTAYPGTSSTGPNSIGLITVWCSDSTELISDFTSTSTQATATITAFKFYNYDNVYLFCSLLVCPPSSSSCTTSCTPGRKRRSLADPSKGDYEKTVGRVLHIIDTPSSASKLGSEYLLSFLLMYLVSLL